MTERIQPKMEQQVVGDSRVKHVNGPHQLPVERYYAEFEDPIKLIPELCNHFYHLGWASGTGGGLSIRQNGYIYCAPSGVQKELMRPDEMFILDEASLRFLRKPVDATLRVSECLSLFLVPFRERQAGCCIHSHSIHANLVTRLKNDGKPINEFRISHEEMIKGIKIGSSNSNLRYSDTLVVPVINNVLQESDLVGALRQAVLDYPDTNAVLVRNHGVYIWGRDWKQAKSMAECYDYLFKLKLEAMRMGLDYN